MDINNELLIFLVSASPVVELRGAIPIGIAKGLSLGKVFVFALAGNLLPIPLLLLFFRWVVTRLEHLRPIEKIFKWWFRRVEKKSKIVETYGFWGLVFFVSIPFPGTGAWTGSVAATLFNFRMKKAIVAISLGVLLAAIFVTLGSMGLVKLWCIFI
ncbi:MAG: small multi-drug export protein [Candidatus Omnitrophota bacterium]|nr:MAG: small multi-drug export protein [Candidatus Omnitrophota bacterium]